MVSERFPKYMSVAEYLAYEEETGVRYEYLDGEIFAMAGGSDRHSTIGLNCGGELRAQLRKKTCRAYNSDLKIKITDIKYVYPDFSVVCGDAQFADEKRTMLINPTFVGEVLSPSTADYDRGQRRICTVVYRLCKPIYYLTKTNLSHNFIRAKRMLGYCANFQA